MVNVSITYQALDAGSGKLIYEAPTKKELNEKMIRFVQTTYQTVNFKVEQVITYIHSGRTIND